MLAVAAAIGALLGWTIGALTGKDGVAAGVAWSGPITLLAAGAILSGLAFSLHQRLQVERSRIDDRQAVAWLALGKAAAVVGAVMGGGYVGFAIRFLPDLQIEGPRERVIKSAVAVVGAIVVTIAGLRIERACEVPESDSDDDDNADQA